MAWLDLPPSGEETSAYVPRVNRALAEKLEAHLRAVAQSCGGSAKTVDRSAARTEGRLTDDDLAFALLLLRHAAETQARDLQAARDEAEEFRQRSVAAEHKLQALTATVMRILPPAFAARQSADLSA